VVTGAAPVVEQRARASVVETAEGEAGRRAQADAVGGLRDLDGLDHRRHATGG